MRTRQGWGQKSKNFVDIINGSPHSADIIKQVVIRKSCLQSQGGFINILLWLTDPQSGLINAGRLPTLLTFRATFESFRSREGQIGSPHALPPEEDVQLLRSIIMPGSALEERSLPPILFLKFEELKHRRNDLQCVPLSRYGASLDGALSRSLVLILLTLFLMRGRSTFAVHHNPEQRTQREVIAADSPFSRFEELKRRCNDLQCVPLCQIWMVPWRVSGSDAAIFTCTCRPQASAVGRQQLGYPLMILPPSVLLFYNHLLVSA